MQRGRAGATLPGASPAPAATTTAADSPPPPDANSSLNHQASERTLAQATT